MNAPDTKDPPIDIEGEVETANKPKPIPTLTTAEIFAELPPLTWTCEGLRIAPGGVTLFAGYGDSAKSVLLQYIAICIATGTPAFGRFAVKKARVLWLDYEQGQRLSRERFHRLARGMGIDFDDLIATGNIALACFPEVYLDDRDAEARLRATVEEKKADVIVFDSYKAGSPETDENKSSPQTARYAHACCR